MSYKNNEGYPAPTEGEAIRRASRMPTHVYNDYCLLNNIAGRLGLEVAVIREKKTGKRLMMYMISELHSKPLKMS